MTDKRSENNGKSGRNWQKYTNKSGNIFYISPVLSEIARFAMQQSKDEFNEMMREHALLRKALTASATNHPAQDRPIDDTLRGQIENIIDFVSSLPAEHQIPGVKSGTKDTPETLATLHWYNFNNALTSVSVTCNTDNTFTAAWDTPDHTRPKSEPMTLEDIKAFNLTEKIKNLTKIQPPKNDAPQP